MAREMSTPVWTASGDDRPCSGAPGRGSTPSEPCLLQCQALEIQTRAVYSAEPQSYYWDDPLFQAQNVNPGLPTTPAEAPCGSVDPRVFFERLSAPERAQTLIIQHTPCPLPPPNRQTNTDCETRPPDRGSTTVASSPWVRSGSNPAILVRADYSNWVKSCAIQSIRTVE